MKQTSDVIEHLCKEIVSKFQIKIGKIEDKITINFYLEDTLVISENVHENDILRMVRGEFEGWMHRFCEDATSVINEGVMNRLYEKLMKLIVIIGVQQSLQNRLNKSK